LDHLVEPRLDLERRQDQDLLVAVTYLLHLLSGEVLMPEGMK
jgi:hypothetical protein